MLSIAGAFSEKSNLVDIVKDENNRKLTLTTGFFFPLKYVLNKFCSF